MCGGPIIAKTTKIVQINRAAKQQKHITKKRQRTSLALF
jgi:hypothetical protein